MFKSLFRRMAPLVAGVVLASASPTMADYCYILSIDWPVNYPGNQYCTVDVAEGGQIPMGYTTAREDDNYFWWFDGERSIYAQGSDGETTATVYPLTVTSVSVYVYSEDDDLSWATSDRDDGTTIWNGP